MALSVFMSVLPARHSTTQPCQHKERKK
uniref:Uncharacterized protein n=1 Tax=Arundo donax TaxID=35708 RepID=A0A0A9BBK2_ARUDO